MSSASSKRSPHPFVPSPRWLTESPNDPPSSGTSNSPWRRFQKHDPRQIEGLLSPVPPPPANLYPDPPDTFNVDPGVPFLATAGSSDVADSPDASESESSRKRRSTSDLVTGIRETVRRSLRRRRRNPLKEPAFSFEQQEIPDSGYGSSSVTAPAPSPTRHPSSTEAHVSHEHYGVQHAVPAQQRHTAGHYRTYTDDDYRRDFDAVAELQGRMSLFSGTVTAETASIRYGSDYAKMEAPLDTEDSLSAYIKRTKHFFLQISALPFSRKQRITYDHYPERDLRDDPRRRPFIEWHRPGNGPTNYSPADESKPVSSPTILVQQNMAVYPPANLDLRQEFSNMLPVPIIHNANSTLQPQVVRHPSPTFQAMSTTHAPVDHSWDEAINATLKSTRNPPMATPFRPAASIDANITRGEWQQYPRYRDGYVPAELAETHYGSRYGPGIHSARAVPASLGSGPSSVTSRKRRKS